MKTNETLKELQVGLQLVPSEVKAMRENRCDLSAAFVDHYDNELFLHQAYVPVWRNGVLGKPDPYRPRKILARRREIDNWIEYLEQRDSQVLPKELIISSTGWLKLIIAQCSRKKRPDTRQREAKRDSIAQIREFK